MTRTLPFMWVDAFTTTPLSGNPCLVILNGDSLSEAEMQTIAREANLSETAFVLSSSVARFRARYFTPAEEIPLAGHPTLSVARALLDSGRLQATDGNFSLQLQAGVVQVDISEAADGLIFTMTQKKPIFGRIYTPEEVMPAFGLTPNDLLPGAVIQTVSTGTPQLMVPLRDHDTLRRTTVNIPLYNQLRKNGDFFSPHHFCVQGISPQGQTFARHFGTPPDLLEDPFTGSATGGMAAYLWHHRLIAAPRFIAEQGHWMGRPGRGYAEVIGSPDAMEAVKVGGPAVTLMRGEMVLPD